MPNFAADDFSGQSAGESLYSSTASDGGTWTVSPLVSTPLTHLLTITDVASVRPDSPGFTDGAATHSGTPPSADYVVECDLIFLSDLTLVQAGVLARHGGGETYRAVWDGFASRWEIGLGISGSGVLGFSTTGSFPAGATYHLKFTLVGDTLTLSVDDVDLVTVTDATITAAGNAGVCATNQFDNTHGIQIDSFVAGDGGGGAATSYTRSGPVALALGADGVIRLAGNGLTTDTVTLDDNGAGGAFSVNPVTLSDTNVVTTTYSAPATPQTVVISFTNSDSLTDPADLTIVVADLVNVVLLGDSFTASGFRIAQIADILDPDHFGVTGTGAVGRRIDEYVTYLDPSSFVAADELNIAVVQGGANDINQGADAPTILSRISDFASYLKSHGYQLVIWDAMLSGEIIGGPSGLAPGDYNLIRNAVNTSLYTLYTTMSIDFLSDLDASHYLGPDPAFANLTYFSDMLHPTNTGQEVWAGLDAGVIALVRRYLLPSPPPPPPPPAGVSGARIFGGF